MALLPKPKKPLKILTIDGGGLQGISTLLILDQLLNAVARNNGVPDSKPRPCDVFDVIAGIGPGGWLALLLGRFQMDVAAAYAEWYNLIDCITPRSKAEEIFMRLTQHSYFDTERLVEQIEQLTDFYETDKHLFLEPPEGSRCKHVFVSALRTDSKGAHLGYNLFRTYDCPKGARILDGPSDPRKYKISHAFGATGAAKYFTPPWKEPSTKKGRARFLDFQFPSPHNITELALDEMWGLYGTDVEISVVVNIGPGIPNASDFRNIAKRFSWGRTPATTVSALRKRRRSSGTKEPTTDPTTSQGQHEPTDEALYDESAVPHQIKFDPAIPVRACDPEKKKPLDRHTTFGSNHHIDIEEKLKRHEDEIEEHIREKLGNVYPNSTPPYYRLAPEQSAPGTAQNDTSSPKASFEATKRYLSDRRVGATMEEVGQHTPFKVPVQA